MMIQPGPSFSMMDKYSTFLHHLRMEPFQVFCHEKRAEVCRTNPHLSSSHITSLLGSMWRSLKPREKQAYIDVAVSMKPKDPVDSFTQHQPKRVSYQQTPPMYSSPETPPSSPPTPAESVKLILPKLQIIPRAGNWSEIAKLSKDNQ